MVPFARRYRTLLTTPFLLFGLALALAAFGCGVDRSPTSSDIDTASPPDGDGKIYLVFSPQALSAAKVLDDDDEDDDGDLLSTSKVAKPNKKTRLKIEDDGLSLELRIPKGAVDEPVLITMAVEPAPLSWLVVQLGPSGEIFNPDAMPTLKLELDAELVDMDLSSLEAAVASSDGVLADATIVSIETHGDDDGDDDDGDDDGDDDDGDDGDDDDGEGDPSFESVTIVIEIPHFSRYGLRNSAYYGDLEWYIDYLDNTSY